MNLKSLSILIILFISNSLLAQTYYVNSASGNNKNNGESEQSAWKSLKKVNQKTFKPGDIVLFAAGTSYYGQLVPKAPAIKNKSFKLIVMVKV